MSYHIYTTRSIILSKRPFREADSVYNILTRDFGLIRATASGVRKESSKLRGFLEPLVLSDVSLVRGQEYWKITSAESVQPIDLSPYLARPLALIEKLVHGEESHPDLFDTVEESILSDDFGDKSEISLVSQILFHLGYLKEDDLVLKRLDLIKAINRGIEASSLVDSR